MSNSEHNVPAMPTLAMLGDNGGVVTVNPDWCDWYEEVFNVPAGEGYIKGREIMQQIDGTFSEFIGKRTEEMKSAIHLMLADDPNTPSVKFSRIEEARKSFTLVGKHAMDFDSKEGEFTLDGYFSVTDLEAILFIHRAEELIGKAKERFGDFFGEAGNNTEKLDVNQLMQVMTPGRQVTDIDSEIFATPVAESPNRAYMFPDAKPSAFADLPKEAYDGYADRAVGITEQRMTARLTSPMAEQFNSVVEAHATLTESGILRQNLTRAVNGSFHIEGYFTPKDLEAILYLYRNNDPLVLPEKDANGLPKDKLQGPGVLNGPRSVWNSLSGQAVPEGFDVTAPELQEGDVLNRTHITSDGYVLHIANDAKGDQAFYKCTKHGTLLTVTREPTGTRSAVMSTYMEGLNGLLDSALEHPSAAKSLLPTGNAVMNRLLTEGGGLRRGEWPGEVSARTAINNTVLVGGTRIHSFEEGDDDFPMLTSLLKKLETFEEQFVGLALGDMEMELGAYWATGGRVSFVKEDGYFSLVFKKDGVVTPLFSLKGVELKKLDGSVKTPRQPDQIVLLEHKPEMVGYVGIAVALEKFDSITPEKVAEAKAEALKGQDQ